MKRKLQFLTKTLLVAAGLCVGSMSAWAGIMTPSAGVAGNTTAWNTWDEGFTQNYTMSGNSTASFTFHYTADPSASDYAGWTMFIGKTINTTNVWDTWITCKGFDGNYYGADGLGGTRASSNTFDGTLSSSSCTEADVTVTISRTAEIITAVAAVDPTNGADDYTITWTYTYGGSDVVDDDLYISFAVEKAYLVISNVVGTGIKTTQADINFSNSITAGAVAGTLNSMALSGSNFELGYTSGEPATTVLGDVLRVGNGTGTVTIPDAQLAGTRDEVILTFDYYFGHLSGKYAGFYLYDASSNVIGALSINAYEWATASMVNSFGFTLSDAMIPHVKTNDATICTDANKITFELHLDYAAGTMYAKQYANSVLKQTTTPVAMGSINPLKSFVVKSDYNNSGRRCWFDNLTIYTIKGDYSIAEVGYTVKYEDTDGNTVKANVTDRESTPGTTISALATLADKTTFYNDGDIANNNTVEFVGATNKYVYKSISAVNSSDEAISELESGAVVTIVYDKYNTYDYSVKQKLGDAAATNRATGTLWGDQTYSYYFPKGVKSGADYYFTEGNGSSPFFGGTLTAAAPTVTINYALDPSVVFYSEGEDLASSTGTFEYSTYVPLSANGSCGVLNNADGNLITSLDAGVYTITARTAGRGDGDRNIYFYKGSVDAGNIVLTANPGNYTASINNSDAFALTETTNILVKGAEGGGLSGRGLDYVVIKRIASVSATLGTNGYTTFASSYPLDLTTANLPDGVTAYKAAVSGNVVNFTPLNQTVLANTGILLKGTASETVNIPVVASGTAVTENAFLVNTTGATITSNETTFYFAMVKDSDPLTFGKITSVAIPANKAYLSAPATNFAGAPALTAIFEDGSETTGINTVQGSEFTVNGEYYNLAGQRVAQPTKGLYIVNGKKVVVK